MTVIFPDKFKQIIIKSRNFVYLLQRAEINIPFF